MDNILAQKITLLSVGASRENNMIFEILSCSTALAVITSLNRIVCKSVNVQHELSKLENYDKGKREGLSKHHVEMRDIEVNNMNQSSSP